MLASAQLALGSILEGSGSTSARMQRGFAFTKLADRLRGVAELSDDDLELLTRMSYTIGHFGSHDHVLRKGD